MKKKEKNQIDSSPLLRARLQEETRDLLVSRTSYLFMVSSVLYPGFSGLDWLTEPDQAMFFLYIRLAVAAILIIGALILKVPAGKKLVLPISIIGVYASILGVSIMTTYLKGFSSDYYIGIVLILFIPGLFLPWNFISTLLFGFFSIATYFFLNLTMGYPPSVTLTNASGPFFFMGWSFLFLAIANIQNEKTRLQDLMQRIQIEKANEDLKEAARYKKDFIANVTHELRTPLTLIRGWTDYILEGESGKVPKKILGIIDKVDLQTLNLTQKINELLKIAKYDAGMETIALTKADINASILQIINSFKGITDKSGIDLNYLNKTKIKDIFIDIEKLKDILNNLIRNSYKFTEKGEIKVTLTQADNMVIIQVKDTGIGMSQKVIQNIFQRFQQGDSSKTRQYEGTGLGLAIVEDCVKMLHGTISVESLENRGSTFTVKLPMDLEKHEPEHIKERRVEDRRTESNDLGLDDRRQKDRRLSDLAKIDEKDILKIAMSEKTISSEAAIRKIKPDQPSKGVIVIAEDNRGIQDLLITALKGYTLFIASNGKTALQAILDFTPSLVISDIMMPIMDGYTLLENIRTNESTVNLPVIIITSLTEQNDRIKSLQLGADDYLTKPFHHLELQARVKNVVSLHKLEREKTRSDQLEVFLMVLASVIESKDEYTGGHVERVAGYARDLARKADLPENQINDIFLGTIVHDVGKIGIKDEVLNKPGRLTDEEFEHIKEHPLIGKNLLSKLEIAPTAVNIAFCHQEKWDGSGYPSGLKGEDIPIEARIATIADVWDAITSDRSYRKSMPLEKAIDIMHQERAKSFDPELFDLFMDESDKLYLNYNHISEK